MKITTEWYSGPTGIKCAVKVGNIYVAGELDEQGAAEVTTELETCQRTATLFISRTVSISVSDLKELLYSDYGRYFLNISERRRLADLVSNAGILRGYLGVSERASIFHQ